MLRCDYVKLGSKRIKTGTVFADHSNNSYVFRQVQHILNFDKKFIFVCKQFDKFTYNSHFDGYMIDDNVFELVCFEYENQNIVPNRFHTLASGEKIIRIKL